MSSSQLTHHTTHRSLYNRTGSEYMHIHTHTFTQKSSLNFMFAIWQCIYLSNIYTSKNQCEYYYTICGLSFPFNSIRGVSLPLSFSMHIWKQTHYIQIPTYSAYNTYITFIHSTCVSSLGKSQISSNQSNTSPSTSTHQH